MHVIKIQQFRSVIWRRNHFKRIKILLLDKLKAS